MEVKVEWAALRHHPNPKGNDEGKGENIHDGKHDGKTGMEAEKSTNKFIFLNSLSEGLNGEGEIEGRPFEVHGIMKDR